MSFHSIHQCHCMGIPVLVCDPTITVADAVVPQMVVLVAVVVVVVGAVITAAAVIFHTLLLLLLCLPSSSSTAVHHNSLSQHRFPNQPLELVQDPVQRRTKGLRRVSQDLNEFSPPPLAVMVRLGKNKDGPHQFPGTGRPGPHHGRRDHSGRRTERKGGLGGRQQRGHLVDEKVTVLLLEDPELDQLFLCRQPIRLDAPVVELAQSRFPAPVVKHLHPQSKSCQ
mmetsp:Transcript_28008/g.61711  ORF Transcript_28008/g.61711 Transcript_28008/m.61711 type:complete len:224 (-) Transcript_28008:1152-1823(-)